MPATPQTNIAAKEAALSAVLSHPMCARIEGDVIIFPDGHYPHGIRVALTARGLQQALAKMEEIWLASFPNPRRTL